MGVDTPTLRRGSKKSGPKGTRSKISAEGQVSGGPVRLQKYMADAGVASRRESERIIAEGRVTVDGEVVTAMGYQVDPVRAKVSVDGKPIRLSRRRNFVYLAVHKPRGYITTADDPEGRKTVYELLAGVRERLVPVGRLDRDSEGLLIFTNDGELVHRLTHPKYGQEKEYQVTIDGFPRAETLKRLQEGVELEDGMTAPAEVTIKDKRENGAVLLIVLREGRNRQIRRMIEAVGHTVRRLLRVREGCVSLRHIPLGGYRHLTADEVGKLRKHVGLDRE